MLANTKSKGTLWERHFKLRKSFFSPKNWETQNKANHRSILIFYQNTSIHLKEGATEDSTRSLSASSQCLKWREKHPHAERHQLAMGNHLPSSQALTPDHGYLPSSKAPSPDHGCLPSSQASSPDHGHPPGSQGLSAASIPSR